MSVIEWDSMPEPWASYGPTMVERIKKAVAGYPELPQRGLQIKRIQAVVADYFGITVADLVSHRCPHNHPRPLVLPRLIAMCLARELTGRSYYSISPLFLRDHHAVKRAVERVRGLCEHDSKIATDVARIRARIMEHVDAH